MITRLIPCVAALALVAADIAPAQAQFKPTRTVEFVVHGGPGSGNDVFARQLTAIIDQEKLAPVRFQVVNKPGGGSTTAANYMASKKNDPHVIACFTNIWLIDPLVHQAATNRLHDMSPIARLVVEPALVVVLADSPFKTLGQFIEAAKANPGKLRWSGGSIMSRENTVRAAADAGDRRALAVHLVPVRRRAARRAARRPCRDDDRRSE